MQRTRLQQEKAEGDEEGVQNAQKPKEIRTETIF